MQNGFSVKFSDFDAKRLTTSGARPAKVPEGKGSATEFPIEYMFPLEGSEADVSARLVMECPMMRSTAKGIQPPKAAGDKSAEEGKPAIQVVFDRTNPEHMTFVGTFGNQYEYTEDDEGRTVQIHKENPIKATGCLGTIRDWCIYQYAVYLASLKGKSTPGPKQFEEAEAKLLKKIFWMKRLHDEGPLKGQVDEDSSPMRYFKLMTYRPGTPEESRAKFCLPDGTKVDPKLLAMKCFLWTPFLSFRRIYDGATFSVTMEVTEAVINDFIETSVGMPIRTSRLVDRLSKENPDQAAMVAEKYRLLQEGTSSEATAPNGTGAPNGSKPSGVKVDEIHTPDTTTTLKETPVVKTVEADPVWVDSEQKTESRSRRRSASLSPEEKRDASPDPEETRTETSSRRRPVLPRRKD